MFNRITLIGTLGGDAELKNLQNGTSFVKFSIATHKFYLEKETGDWKKIVDWSDIIKFNPTEKEIEFLKKGHEVFIDGSIKTSTYEKNGVKTKSTNVVADKIIFFDRLKKEKQESSAIDSIPF